MFEQFSYFLFFLQIYNNINNTYDIIYDAHIMAQSHCESSPSSLDECRLSTRWLSTLRLSQTTWAVSPPIGCYHPHPLLPFYYYSARAILYFKNCDVYTCMLGICPLSRHILRKWPSWTSVHHTYPNLNQGIDVCGQRKVSGGGKCPVIRGVLAGHWVDDGEIRCCHYGSAIWLIAMSGLPHSAFDARSLCLDIQVC